MNDALVKAFGPQLARIALKKTANHKSTALEPQLQFAQLVDKIHKEDMTRTHIDRHKLSTISILSSSINNLSLDIDHLTADDINMMKQDIAQGINVVGHKYSNDPNSKGNHSSKNCVKNCSRSEHSIAICPDKIYSKPLYKPNFQKQTFNEAMKGNQNLPNKQVTSNNVTIKPLPFSYRPRSNIRDRLDNSRHRSLKNTHIQTQNLFTVIVILNNE